MKTVNRKLSWTPKPGRYQCVLPTGSVHIDLYIDGRVAEPAQLKLGEEVELHDKELRGLRKSRILTDGILAPIAYFKRDANGYLKDGDGNILEEPATEDSDNPNIISDDFIYEKVQLVDNSGDLLLTIGGVTSELTLARYRRVCEELDCPLSYMGVIDDQIEKVKELMDDSRKGEIDPRRKELLTEKIKK